MDNSKQSQIGKLMELKQLYEQGILTKEEMEAEKAKILKASASSDESTIKETPSVDTSESSNSIDKGNSHNNKVIFGIAAVIVVAIVAIVALYHNKHNEPKEVAVDDVELAQLTDEAKQDSQEETEDFYKECISLEQVFAVKDNKTSDKLVNLLKSLNYVHKESEDDVNSGDWEKSIIIDGVSSKVKVSWEVGRHTLYWLNMECTEDTIVKRWLSEMKSLGYKVNAIKSDYTEGWDGEKTVNNNPDWVSIFHDKEGKKYSLTAKTGFSAAYGTYEEAEKKAAQKEQEEIKEIESQAISIETVIDAYKNNVDGRADNIFFKKEKVYQFYLNKIRKSSSDYEYVMEGSGSSHGDIADILVYTDDSRLANLNFPLKLCFRGALVSISRPEHGSWFIYHFVCTEALTYRN